MESGLVPRKQSSKTRAQTDRERESLTAHAPGTIGTSACHAMSDARSAGWLAAGWLAEGWCAGWQVGGLAHLAVRAALVHSQPLVKALGMLGVLAREHAQHVVGLEVLLADRALRAGTQVWWRLLNGGR